MSSKSKRITTAIALLFVFAISQVHVGVSFAKPGLVVSGESAAMTPQQTTGVLTTQGNKEITVNGTSAISGATIVSGASIETPAAVGATVSLGSRGSLEIEPSAKLTVGFDQTSIKVMLIEGCVTLHTKKGTTGEIVNEQGRSLGKTDPTKDDVLRVCFPRSGAAPIAGSAGGGLSGGAIAAIVVGGTVTAIGIGLALRGKNPSPGAP